MEGTLSAEAGGNTLLLNNPEKQESLYSFISQSTNFSWRCAEARVLASRTCDASSIIRMLSGQLRPADRDNLFL